MTSRVIRILFFSICVLLGVYVSHSPNAGFDQLFYGFFIAAGVALSAIGLEIILSRRISGLVPSFLLGLFLAGVTSWGIQNLLHLIPGYSLWADNGENTKTLLAIQIAIMIVCSYIWISIVVKSRDTFKLSIPYVEFKRQGRGLRALVLDSSCLIDGRIVDLANTHLLDRPVIVPRFILLEMQNLADNSDKMIRQRGRRGLDKTKELRSHIDVRVDESIFANAMEVDQRLLQLTRQLDAVLMTTDYNLAQVASLEDIDCINMNEVAQAFKSVYLPGDTVDIQIMKTGEEDAQGVGYLEDGTMVVVDRGRDKVGQTVSVKVTSNLQTSVGRMIFARCEV